MIKTLLPNARFLTIKSDHLGRDWSECAQILDTQLDALGMDLASESVYLLFDRSPGAILAGEGEVLVARPVIGPKKQLEAPLAFLDWVQAPVYSKILTSFEWGSLLDECLGEWESLQRQNLTLAAPFMLVVKKKLCPQLELGVEVLFHG